MLEHPAPTAVDAVYHPESKKGPLLKAALTRLVERRQRFECTSLPEVSIVDEPEYPTASRDLVRVVIHVRQSPCRLLEASGAAVGQQLGFARRAFSYTLKRIGDKWYIISDQDLGEVE